jgi:hypothetical protein
MTRLERVFEETGWNRKFKYQSPKDGIVRMWREKEAADAQRWLGMNGMNGEKSEKATRSLWLGHDALGQFLAVVEWAFWS